MMLLETVFQDLQYGVRMLFRHAGSTVVTVLALALGIGVNTTVFTGYRAIVARPLDARAPAEMVNIALNRDSGVTEYTFSYPDYEAYGKLLRSFSGLVAFRPARVTLSNAGEVISQRASASGTLIGRMGLLRSGVGNAEFASVFIVSENYFKVLGVNPLQGRTFESIRLPEQAAAPAVLISENYWQRRFAGEMAILGKTVYLNGLAVTVVGITPHDFVGTGMGAPAFWLPVSMEPLINADERWLDDRENRRYRLFGRLAAGFTMRQAQAEMSLIADHLRTLHDARSEPGKPATAQIWPGSPFPLPLKQYGGLTLAISLILAAAGMVLAVACANVGSLQLARARSRENELRTRISLGASRSRVIRQLLTESTLLGLLAGVLALFFTWALLKVSVALIANALPAEYGTLVFDVTPDLGIFALVAAVSLFAGMLSGLAPAMESSRSALSSVMRASTSSVRSRRLQDVLVAAQVALSLILMVAGSVAVRSSVKSLAMDTGYDTKHVFALDFQFPETAQYTAARKGALVHDLRTRLAALPGVLAMTSARPPGGSRFRTVATAQEGETSSSRNVQSGLSYAYVQANYFQTLGIPLILGRSFERRAGQSQPSVVLSESAAKRLWPGQNPLGRSLRLGATDERVHSPSELFASGPAYQVIGVARDARGAEFNGSDSHRVYLPIPDDRLSSYPLLIRTRSGATQVMRTIDPVISSLDPNLMATSSTLEEMLRQSAPFITSSLAAAVSSTIGLLGLLLALMGIYGTVSYIVVLRTREVGIRMAIGAQKRDILGLILRESARPVLAGLSAGAVLAAGASQLAHGLLYGLDGIDGVSLVGVSFLFLTIALLASYPPARRAMRVDPMVALRYE